MHVPLRGSQNAEPQRSHVHAVQFFDMIASPQYLYNGALSLQNSWKNRPFVAFIAIDARGVIFAFVAVAGRLGE